MKFLRTNSLYPLLAVLVALLLTLNCTSPEAVGKLDGAVKPARIRAHLKILSDDIMEGRAPGSRGGELAAKYIASQFEEAGLVPAAALVGAKGPRFTLWVGTAGEPTFLEDRPVDGRACHSFGALGHRGFVGHASSPRTSFRSGSDEPALRCS